MSNYYVYIHCKPNGDPFYVGKGLIRRCFQLTSNRNGYHQNHVKKYGVENIEVLIFDCGDNKAAIEKEVLWIKTLRDAGYSLSNLTTGGENGTVMSDDTRRRMSDASKGKPKPIGVGMYGKKHSAETRLKMSIAAKKIEHKPHSEETKAKMSKSRSGRIFSDETRRKISEANIGRKRSAESIAKQSASISGRTLSQEHKKKIADGLKAHYSFKHSARSAVAA